jgi:hypothetical protein
MHMESDLSLSVHDPLPQSLSAHPPWDLLLQAREGRHYVLLLAPNQPLAQFPNTAIPRTI